MRNNQERLGDFKPESAEAPAAAGFKFVTPTFFVDLPSKGKLYSLDNPLHGVESVEIREMTAREEDILYNRSFIDKGIVLDRLLESIIVNRAYSVAKMLIMDKNALLVAARISGYGNLYPVNLQCGDCGSEFDAEIDLNSLLKTEEAAPPEGSETLESGLVKITLPKTKWEIIVKPLLGEDQARYQKILDMKRKNNLPENVLIETIRSFIYSVNGETLDGQIYEAIYNMPAVDSKHLRTSYGTCFPSVSTEADVVCSVCDTAQKAEVPFNANFFWSK